MLLPIRDIRKRIYYQNKNYMCIVLGETGSGKSYTTMRICEILDPYFTVDDICFSAEEFIQRLRAPGIKRGRCLILDEAGTSLSSREFWSLQNRRISYILQTYRHRNLITFFTVPNLRFIDAQVRPLFHGMIKTCWIDKQEKLCRIKWMWLESSEESGAIYRHRYMNPATGHLITYYDMALPSKKLIRPYEAKKLEFSDKLQDDSLKALKKEREKEEPKEPNRTCPGCNYSWFYKGSLDRISCPQCGKNFRWSRSNKS